MVVDHLSYHCVFLGYISCRAIPAFLGPYHDFWQLSTRIISICATLLLLLAVRVSWRLNLELGQVVDHVSGWPLQMSVILVQSPRRLWELLLYDEHLVLLVVIHCRGGRCLRLAWDVRCWRKLVPTSLNSFKMLYAHLSASNSFL